MELPTTYQIRTAIEVLGKLGERINQHATNSVRQIPRSHVAGNLAGQIVVNAREQTTQVQAITGLLETWHAELNNQRKQHVSHHV